MKTVINIFLACVTVLSIVSCGTLNKGKTADKYNSQTINRLSKQFGVRLTQADNLLLYSTCSDWLGVKYRYGGKSKKGVDCSGLVGILYKQVYRKTLERNTANILKNNCAPVARNKLREGDLVFFKTSGSRKSRVPTHVGLYLKNGKFIHASASKGVIVSSLAEPYYIRTWITGGRLKR